MSSSPLNRCPQCSYESQWNFAIVNHLKRCHTGVSVNTFNCFNDVKLHQCTHCFYKSEMLVTLFLHNDSHRTLLREESCEQNVNLKVEEFKVKQNKCPYCQLLTFSKIFLFKHLKRCKKKKLVKSNEMYSLTKLAIIHKGEWLHCPDCLYQSKIQRHLLMHINNKHLPDHQVEWFKCKHCKFQTKYKHSLRNHQLTIHETLESLSMQYKCAHCSLKTYVKSDLIQHLKHKHTIKMRRKQIECSKNRKKLTQIKNEINWFDCAVCKFRTKSLSLLKKHHDYNHTNSGKWLQCLDCGYRAQRRYAMELHQKHGHFSNVSIKWFDCTLCEFRTKSSKLLERHHGFNHSSGTDWYECADCGFKTKRKRVLEAHKINEHGSKHDVKRFVCTICTFRTKFEENLNRHHARTHNMEKVWFRCTDCPYKTVHKSYLNLHKSNKHSPNMKKIEGQDDELKVKQQQNLKVYTKKKLISEQETPIFDRLQEREVATVKRTY